MKSAARARRRCIGDARCLPPALSRAGKGTPPGARRAAPSNIERARGRLKTLRLPVGPSYGEEATT